MASPEQSKNEQFDPETVAKDLKKEGSDWMTMFNPNVKRVLDVGLVHTLVHDSCVSLGLGGKAGELMRVGAGSFAASSSRRMARCSRRAATGIRRCTTPRRAPRSRESSSCASCATRAEERCSVLFDESSGVKADNYIRSASFSPDGKLLATGSEDRIVRVRPLPPSKGPH